MPTELIVTKVEKLQEKIHKKISENKSHIGIYVSLNKTQKAIEDILKKKKITTKNLFFIDCMTDKKEKEDVLHISPQRLDELKDAIRSFLKEIPQKKYIIIDALSTLLIYNDENKVASFVKDTIEIAQKKDTDVIAFSPVTKGEDLLNKIFNFFDEVKRDDEGKQKKSKSGEEWIY